MTTFMRNGAVAAAFLIVALGVSGCDDESGGDGGGPTTTTSTTSTSTTTSTSSTSSSSTTTSSTTTSSTTLPDGGVACMITFGVTNTVTLGALQYNADYSASPGAFDGSGAGVECTPDPSLGGAIVTFNDDEPAQTLRTGIISLSGFAAPTDVATCNWTGTATPVTGDFTIEVVDATAPDLSPVSATVEITNIECTATGTTTTMGGTTTTMGVTTTTQGVTTTTQGVTTTTQGVTTTTAGVTTTTTGGTTTTIAGNPQFSVLYSVPDTVNIGALQFNSDYSAAPGGFVGAADSVDCSPEPALSGAIFTPNDDEAATTLRIGIISLGGISAPADLLSCLFEQTGGTAPVDGDFVNTVVDAAQPDLTPIDPEPTVETTVTAAP